LLGVLESKDAIYVIDASAFIFRAYYAMQPFSSKGRPSHAVMGFASMLLRLVNDKSPKSFVVVFDSKKPTFRKEIYPEYKANREVAPPDLSDQIVAVMDFCKQGNFPILQEEGLEADDWIGSFVRTYEKKHPIVIVSSDKDLAQLLSKNVVMYDTFREKVMGPKEVVEKWGVKPDQMRDLLALMGDSSDNIPGVAGVGPKSAANMINEFGSVAEIIKKKDKLPEKFKKKIEPSLDNLKLSYELVGLKEDLNMPFKAVPDVPTPFDPKVREFLFDWDCNRLLKHFPNLLGKGDSLEEKTANKSSGKEAALKLAKTKKDLDRIVSECKKAKQFVFDIETNSFNKDEATLVGISFAWDNKEAWYVPIHHGKVDLSVKDMKAGIEKLLSDKSLQKIAHNLKYDYEILTREGYEVVGPFGDTMIAAYLCHADRRSFSLANLAHEFVAEQKGDLKALLDGSEDFSTVKLEDAVDYAAQDSHLTMGLFDEFSPKVHKDKEMAWLYENVEMPLVPVLARMEEAGVLLDTKRMKELSLQMHKKLSATEKKIYKTAGSEFNIQSPKQLQKVLFEDLGLEPIKKTKTGYSTNEAVLTELAEEHELPNFILKFRGLAKLTSTYVDVLPEMIAKRDKRLHTSYHQTGTKTGRLSSSEPNLQNIPTRSEEGKLIREAFIPEKGFQFFSADYSQVELRLFAHLANDKNMIKAFSKGADIHSETAKLIFGSDDKEFRNRAKAINFGIIYGISAFGLANQLKIERKEAKEIIDAYYDKFTGIEDYMEKAVKMVKKNGYTETLFGRQRPLPDINSKNGMLRQMAERAAINAPLQGTAADIMKWAMVRVDEGLRKSKMKSRLILQVHDELIIETAKGEEKAVESLVTESMADLSKTPAKVLKVPLVVDSAFGKSWAELK
jgi:DNA polymerase-1